VGSSASGAAFLMSNTITILYYGLWIAHPVLETAIAMLMIRRGLHRQFRFFFGYILTQIVSFALVVPVYWYRHNYHSFFYLYWACLGISVAFGFGVIHEVFVDVFRAFHTLRDLGTVLFKWAGLVMLLVAGVVSVSAVNQDVQPWMQAIITAQRCVRIVQIGMVLFLLFFAHYLGVSRRQRSFGIALGFGWFAIVELTLIASWVGNHLGNPWMSIVNMTAYNLTLGVWVGYVAVKSADRDSALNLLQPQRWEQSLSDIHHPVPADSLIPMFENMVDRALSRTQREAPTETGAKPAAPAGLGATPTASGFPLAARAGSKT
jgi:hypothetical protein